MRVLVLMSAALLFFGATACATADPPARPAATTSTEATTTVMTASITAAPTTTKAEVPTETRADQRRAACREDESQCYEPGTNTKCQTGGCVDAARGMTQRDVETERDKWLRRHPGWCPAGETGAVAPC